MAVRGGPTKRWGASVNTTDSRWWTHTRSTRCLDGCHTDARRKPTALAVPRTLRVLADFHASVGSTAEGKSTDQPTTSVVGY